MADQYDVSSQALPYGSVGGAAFRGMQSELMRRAQQEAADRAETERQQQLAFQRQQTLLANARQSAQDQRQAAQDVIANKKTLEELASSVENRKSMEQQRELAGYSVKANAYTATHEPGSPMTDADVENVRSNPLLGAGFILSQPSASMTAAPPLTASTLPGALVDAATGDTGTPTPTSPDAGPGAVLSLAHAFKGTPKQLDDQSDRQAGDDFVAGKLDPMLAQAGIDPAAIAAAKAEVSINRNKAGVAAALGKLFTPKPVKPPTETKAADDIAIEKILAKPHETWTPDEIAKVEARQKFNKLQGEEAKGRLNISVTAAQDRQGAGFEHTDTAAETRYVQTRASKVSDSIKKETDVLSTDQGRNDKALMALSKPGWVSDASAVPEYLQIMAGGMGSGLRMTTAEINKVQYAQSYFDQLKAKMGRLPFSEYFLGQPRTIQDEMRKQMIDLLTTVRAARDRTVKIQADTIKKLGNPNLTADDVAKIESDYVQQRNLPTMGPGSDAPAASSGATSGAVGHIDPATGKLVRY